MRKTNKRWPFRTYEVAGFIVLSCLACLSLATLAVWLDLSTARSAFDERAGSLQRTLAHQFGNTDTILTSLAGLHHSNERLNDYEFAGQARELLAAYPFVSAVVQADVLARDDVQAFEARMRSSGFVNFQVRGDDPDAAGNWHASVLPIVVLEPFDPVLVSLVGYDVLSNARLARAVDVSVSSGQVVTSDAVNLPVIGDSIFIFKAFYLGHTSPHTVELRRTQSSGVVAVVLKPQRFFEQLVAEYDDLNFSFVATKAGALGFTRPLFEHVPSGSGTPLPFVDAFVSRVPITGNDAAFAVEIRSAPTLRQIRVWLVVLLVVIGACGCGFLGLAILNKRAGLLRSQEDERILRENQEKFRDYAEIASDWFWSTDATLRFDYSSHASEKSATAYLQALLTGDRDAGSLEIDPAVAQQLAENLRERQPFRDVRYSYICRSGIAKWWAVSGKPVFQGNGEFCGYRGTGRNVTSETEARLALIRSKEEAEIANRSKSEFVANMSHELRTPLNAIIGFSEMLQTEIHGPLGADRYRNYATDIQDSGRHLLSLINDILDLSKVESGVDDLYEEAIVVADVVRSLMVIVKPHAEKGGVALHLDIADGMPKLLADERKIKQILVNILSNAIKFTRAGGDVTLSIRYDSASGFTFRIEDNGIGMTPREVEKALLKFGQIDSDLNRKYDGTGLGLPLSRALTELHGGILEIDSAKGEGTTVTVRLPVSRTMSVQRCDDSPDEMTLILRSESPARHSAAESGDNSAEDDAVSGDGPASPPTRRLATPR